ncbi:carbohydrate porin [Photobacterium satsumensis]|uniref:carbohydrate porin n=1 Tax=Photobacterium satsumensis TaxID=2910239 RepID=UPI003D09C589
MTINPAFGGDFGGPSAVENRLADESANFGLEYISVGVISPNGSNGNSVNRASGLVQFYGEWDLLDGDGGIIFKIGHRHSYTDTPVSDLSFADDLTGGPEGIGYVGSIGSIYTDVGFLVSNLHWMQRFNGGNTSVKIGWQDVTDYVDAYALANPVDGFNNLVFSTGSGSMGIPDEGVLAISAGHMITDNYYVVGSIADANGQSEDIFDGFNTAFNDGAYFTTIELGWTASQEQIYTDNVHITLWGFGEDTRHSNATGEGGKGINFSASWFATDNIMPFIRGGFSDGDVAIYDKSISVGIGYYGLGKPENTLGLAVNWAETNEVAFGGDEQYTAELYYNMQLGKHVQITPDIQYIKNPAASSEDSALVFGLRTRLFL